MSESALVAGIDLDRVLELGSVRDGASRAVFLAALRELGRDAPPFSVPRLERLATVEDHFQSLLLYGQLEFLRQPFGASDADRDFALNVQRIWLEAANGLQRHLRNRSAWARRADAHERVVHATALAVHAIHGYVKWGGLLGEPGRGTPWKQLHALYALAEAEGYARSPVQLHASEPGFRPTVESLYLRALLFELLNTGTLSRMQMEIVDGWLAAWCGEYALEKSARAGRHFLAIDLASESGMQPIARRAPGANPRFLRADAIGSQIGAMQAELRHGRLHAECGAGAVFPIEEHAALLGVLEKVQRSIIAGGESRLGPRTPFEDREVDVAIGIERVMRKLREAPAAARPAEDFAAAVSGMQMIEMSPGGLAVLDAEPQLAAAAVETPAADPDLERWRVQDLSARGYGLLVDRATAEGTLLNGIVALRNHETGGWIVGSVVRKQPSRGRGEVLIGVEVLGFRPIAVELAPDGPSDVPAIFLPGSDAEGRGDSLLLPLSDFRAGSRFSLRVQGERYDLRLNRITGKGADWVSARFEIEPKA